MYKRFLELRFKGAKEFWDHIDEVDWTQYFLEQAYISQNIN